VLDFIEDIYIYIYRLISTTLISSRSLSLPPSLHIWILWFHLDFGVTVFTLENSLHFKVASVMLVDTSCFIGTVVTTLFFGDFSSFLLILPQLLLEYSHEFFQQCSLALDHGAMRFAPLPPPPFFETFFACFFFLSLFLVFSSP